MNACTSQTSRRSRKTLAFVFKYRSITASVALWVRWAHLFVDAAIVVPAEYFDASASLSTVEAENCTIIHGVPTMFVATLE